MSKSTTFVVSYRDGSSEAVKVSPDLEHGKINVQVNGVWWVMTAGKNKVLSASRQKGHYFGSIVQTVKGQEIRFDHNGHVYAAPHPITAFARMVRGEAL